MLQISKTKSRLYNSKMNRAETEILYSHKTILQLANVNSKYKNDVADDNDDDTTYFYITIKKQFQRRGIFQLSVALKSQILHPNLIPTFYFCTFSTFPWTEYIWLSVWQYCWCVPNKKNMTADCWDLTKLKTTQSTDEDYGDKSTRKITSVTWSTHLNQDQDIRLQDQDQDQDITV